MTGNVTELVDWSATSPEGIARQLLAYARLKKSEMPDAVIGIVAVAVLTFPDGTSVYEVMHSDMQAETMLWAGMRIQRTAESFDEDADDTDAA